MDNKKAEVRDTDKYGKGVFATEDIKKDEIVAEFDGKIYEYEDDFSEDVLNHAIQFEKRRWRDSDGIARIINHSCEPNCGVKDLFKIVAMRNIKKGEELTWDYEMTEDNIDWRMKCRCNTPCCRRVIGRYKNMPEKTRKKYKGYISDWLLSQKVK